LNTATPLSPSVKQAIKVALSVVISLGIALWMDWSKPLWAGFAVVIISLPTEGESLNRGAMRLFGTLVGVTLGLALVALFPQDRWLYMTVLSLHIGLCSYMMTGKRHQYFWYASGFVTLVVAADASNSMTPFQVAVERSQETGTGILVYSLIASFLWPTSSRRHLEETSRELLAVQHGLYRAYHGLMNGEGHPQDSRGDRRQELQLLAQFEQLLNAAESESYAVWEARAQWRYLRQQSVKLAEALGEWRVGLRDVDELDLNTLVPNFDALWCELDQRFADIGRMLNDEAPTRVAQTVTLSADLNAVGNLTHFRQAAVLLTKTHLQRIEALSRSLFECVRDLRGYGEPTQLPAREAVPGRLFVIDPDRIQGVMFVVTMMWTAFLLFVYIDPPGHAGFVFVSTIFAMVVVRTDAPVPEFAIWQCIGALVAGIPYIFIMPHLATYVQLAPVIFALVFAMHYLFTGGARMALLINFIATLSLQNEQSYDFASFANATAKTVLVAGLLVTVAYVVTSPRQEKKFVRQFRRFFRHVSFLISNLNPEERRKRGVIGRLKAALYQNDLLELPRKLAQCGERIDYRAIPTTTPEQVQALVASLFVLAFHVKGLVEEAHRHSQAAILERSMEEEFRAWQQFAEERFRIRADQAVFAAELDHVKQYAMARLDRLETHVKGIFDHAGEAALSTGDIENFYRLLGSYRGLSEAAIDVDRAAAEIDWARWREARF